NTHVSSIHSFPTRRSSDLYKIGSAMLQVRLGRCYFEMNNIDKALYYGLESEKIADMESSFQFEKERKQHESEKLQRDLEIKNQRDRKSTRLNSSHVKISYA